MAYHYLHPKGGEHLEFGTWTVPLWVLVNRPLGLPSRELTYPMRKGKSSSMLVPRRMIWKGIYGTHRVSSGICTVWDDEIPWPKAMLDMLVSRAFPKSTGSSFFQTIFAQTQGTRMNVVRFVTKWNLPESKLNHPIQNSRGHQSVSVLYWIHEFEDLRSSKSRLFVASRTEWCQLRHAPATSP